MSKVEIMRLFWGLILIFLLFAPEKIMFNHLRAEEVRLNETEKPKEEIDPNKFYEWTKSIFDLIDQLESDQPEEQEQAFAKLRQIGLPVIPFLVERLKSKGIYLDLACQIIRNQKSDVLTVPSGKELPLIEKYYYGKYLQVVQLFRQKKYQAAIGLINAVLLLEPRVSFRDTFKQLKIRSKEQLLQQKVLKATLSTPKELYERGDRIKIRLSLENLTLSPVEIFLGKMNLAVLYMTIAEYGPLGDFNSLSRMEEIKLPTGNINLDPGKIWETTFVVDTARDNPQSINYATYTLKVEIRPIKLKSAAGETIRKITTPRLTLKIFPPEIEPVLKNPLSALGKALDGGIPIDIFLCTLLVPKQDYEKELTLLMPALEKSDESTKKVIMNCLKHITGLPFEINEQVWLDWWQNRQKFK